MNELTTITAALQQTHPDGATPIAARMEWEYLTLTLADKLLTADPHFDYQGFLDQVGFYRRTRVGD